MHYNTKPIEIKQSKNTLTDAPQKYTRVVLTSDKPRTWHRVKETEAGHTEFWQGTGAAEEMTARTFRICIRQIVQSAKQHELTHVAVEFDPTQYTQLTEYGEAWCWQTIAENLVLAAYEFRQYKSNNKKNDTALREVLLCGVSRATQKRAIEKGQTIAQAANAARDIANTPGDDMTPKALASAASKLAKDTDVRVKTFGKREIKAQKLGLLDAVGKGAANDPQFIVMEYRGSDSKKQSLSRNSSPLVLIGKGITYDTGGLNVKPSGGMHDMHMDMSGGAGVIAAITAAARLGVKKDIVALIPAAENAVSSESMRAGDIVTAHSGKTVEVRHTDAEGRMVMADAYSYAQKHYNPRAIIDVATLTGAALVALGKHASAIMSRDSDLQNTLTKLGDETGDYTWPLPLWSEYEQYLKSDHADISNIDPTFSRFGGAIEGGTFLSFFAPKDVPWAHIDMASRMDAVPTDKLAKGATGEPVRLLVKYVESASI